MGFGGGLVLAATAGVAWLENRRVQGWCAATALAAVAMAWVAALVSSG
jgi:7-keto-8-aminopelargonate synthetase-like enzyme